MKGKFFIVILGLLLTSCGNNPNEQRDKEIYEIISKRIENGKSHLNELKKENYIGNDETFTSSVNPIKSASDIKLTGSYDPSKVETDEYYEEINTLFPYKEGYKYYPAGSYKALLIPVAQEVNSKYEFAFSRLTEENSSTLNEHPFLFHTSIVNYQETYAYWFNPACGTKKISEISGIYEDRLNTTRCIMLDLMKNTTNFNYDVFVGLDNLDGIFLFPKNSNFKKDNFDKADRTYINIDFNKI